jgi:hypothetical protein
MSDKNTDGNDCLAEEVYRIAGTIGATWGLVTLSWYGVWALTAHCFDTSPEVPESHHSTFRQ